MVTLLFAVFVVLYALKDDGEKIEAAAGSLEESFNKPLEDIPPSQRIGPLEQGFGIFDHLKGNTTNPPMIDKFPETPQNIKLIEDEMNKVKGQLAQRFYGEHKFRDIDDPGLARVISVYPTHSGFRVRLLAQHFYQPGSYQIKGSARKDLDHVIETLKQLQREVRVEGHTDSIEKKGVDHWDLSALRATYVLKYMIQEHNFAPSLLTAAGYGDSRPIASNATAKSRSLNRRLEFNIRYSENDDLDNQP